MYPECVKLASLRHGDIYAAKHEQLKALAAHQNEKGGRNSLKKKERKMPNKYIQKNNNYAENLTERINVPIAHVVCSYYILIVLFPVC